jgi:arginine-tRNA-protein transferase
MQYKIRYRPLERLSRNGWTRFDPEEQTQAVQQADSRDEPALPRELAAIFRK